MRKQITQAELRAVVRANASLDRRMFQIRQRLHAGASVEPGKLDAKIEKGWDSWHGIPEYVGYSNVGLHIGSAERIEEYRRLEVAHA